MWKQVEWAYMNALFCLARIPTMQQGHFQYPIRIRVIQGHRLFYNPWRGIVYLPLEVLQAIKWAQLNMFWHDSKRDGARCTFHIGVLRTIWNRTEVRDVVVISAPAVSRSTPRMGLQAWRRGQELRGTR